MKNILVTGCNGQLGNEMQLLATGYPEFNYFFTDVKELDITDENAVKSFVKTNGIDCVVNCAAYTAVDKAQGGCMIQVSTDYVFDGTTHIPYREEEPTCPATVYGRTKLAGEEAVMRNCPESVIIRTAWLYSTFGNNFVKTMLRLGREKESLGVIFDQIGTPTYARDLAAAIFAVLTQDFVPGIYHFSNEGAISWYDFTKAIHRIAGITTCKVRPLHTEEYPAPAARPHYSVLDKTKIKETYHIDIPYWEDSLAECIQKLEQN